jgi:hypothetical protein
MDTQLYLLSRFWFKSRKMSTVRAGMAGTVKKM